MIGIRNNGSKPLTIVGESWLRLSEYSIILNLKRFNGFLKFKHWKLEFAEYVLALEGCYFGSVDVKDAHYSISINEDYQKDLKIYYKKENYK